MKVSNHPLIPHENKLTNYSHELGLYINSTPMSNALKKNQIGHRNKKSDLTLNLYCCILIPEFHFPSYNSCGTTLTNSLTQQHHIQ